MASDGRPGSRTGRVTAPPAGGELLVQAIPSELRRVRDWVTEVARAAGSGETMAAEVAIAVNEACTNVIQHAYRGDASGTIVVQVFPAGADLVCRVLDRAPPADPAAIRPRKLDELRPGGLGTHFMAELMDACRFGRLDDACGNYVEMRRRIE